jgi:Fe-S-cluster containining protein
MIRRGECNDCGYCCRVISTVELYFPTKDAAFKEARGISPRGTKQIDVIDPCQHHTGIGCAIHTTRPQTCRDFPTNPEEIKNTPCSYWFEDEKGNRL